MNFFNDSKEWQWLFRNAVDWDRIIPLYYKEFPTRDGFNNKEEALGFFEEMLGATGGWAAEALAPRAAKLDQEGAGKIVDGRTVVGENLGKSYKEAQELQLFGLCVDPQYGGLGAPAMLGLFTFAQLSRACISTASQLGFFGTIADMIERFCTEEDRNKYIPQIIAGELSGSMCLTEPGAGSDVGAIKTMAVRQKDGTFLLNGTKQFITNAGGGVGFVLARTKDAPEGLKGLSLFFVDQRKSDGTLNFQVTKNEEKMGLHGCFTCELIYENTIATLIGEENEGFTDMLYLMNEARIGVGVQALGGMEACLDTAKAYAKTRQQFGKSLLDLPLYRRNFSDWETERDAFRAFMVDTMSYFDIYQKLDLKKRHTGDLNEDDRKLFDEALKWVRRRTPLVKYYGAETFTKMSTVAIQALGGYGYMREYGLERLHRDSFGPLLYEGTSQIQALMAMKDLMKYVMKNPGKFFQSIFYSHPFGIYFSEDSELQREYIQYQYNFKKAVSGLLMRVFKPGIDSWDFSELLKVFSAKNWFTEEKIDIFMIHAETLCQSLSYLETLRVVAIHASKDKERTGLYERYRDIVRPRLSAIYEDWKIR